LAARSRVDKDHDKVEGSQPEGRLRALPFVLRGWHARRALETQVQLSFYGHNGIFYRYPKRGGPAKTIEQIRESKV
jgi:hypothetical protein